MRVSNCADCRKEIAIGEIMFPVYWSLESTEDVQLSFLCKDCVKNELREGLVPGGRL
jgi:hypothetical protein